MSIKPNNKTVRVEDFLDLIRTFTVSVRAEPFIVWRGQTRSEWGLTPSLFRSEPKWKNWKWDSKEDGLLRCFEKSSLHWDKDLHPERFIDRLTLAQHHRLPTRLLDWTESPLIASFFACIDVTENAEKLSDGAVWQLRTNSVSFKLPEQKRGRKEVPDGSHGPALPEDTQKGLNEDFDTFLFCPRRLHPRQINQLAAYTVHPNPNLKNSSDFSQTLRSQESLVQYIIPKEIKEEALAKLWSLGTRYENIFPDSEGAANGAKYVIETQSDSLSTSLTGRAFGAR